LAEEVRELVGRAEPVNGGVRHHHQVDVHERHRERDVEPIGHTVGDECGRLAHRSGDRIHCGDDVLPSAQQFGVVVGEHRRDGFQVESLDAVVREPLERKSHSHPASADRFRAIGEDRAEAGGRPLKHAERRIEAVGESRRGGWQRHAHQGPDQRRVELAEVRLEAAGEMRAVRLFARQRGKTVDHQAMRTVEVREQRGQAVHGCGQVVRFLRRRG